MERDCNALIVAGLGNYHPNYLFTRHNFGFLFIDYCCKKLEIDFKKEMEAEVAYKNIKEKRVIFLKPITWMNLSGKVIKKWIVKTGISPGALIIVYDDISIPFGRIRIRRRGSDGGHNGMASVIQETGTSEIPRIRLGTGPLLPSTNLVDFVLGKWTEEELKKIPEILENTFNALMDIINYNLEVAMNKYNAPI